MTTNWPRLPAVGQAAEVDMAAMDRNVEFYEEHFEEYANEYVGSTC